MAEQNKQPRRSTRAPKPELDKQPRTEPTSSQDAGSSRNTPRPESRELVNGGAAEEGGKRQLRTPLNARNERPGKNENQQDANAGKPTGGHTPKEKKEGAVPAKPTRGADGEKPSSKGTANPSPRAKAGTPAAKGATANQPLPGRKDSSPKMDAAQDKPEPQTKKGDETPHSKDSPKEGQLPDTSKAGGAASGAKGKAKSELKGSNATGVDYSDKGLKDQLEHQAADVAMDATPVLGQINSARKALKNANKKKKELSGNPDSDDVLDKTEKAADKTVDAGIKTAKVAVGGAAGAGMGYAAASMLMLMKTLMFLKGMAFGIAGKIAGFFVGAFQAISSFVTGALGVSAAIGNAVASGVIALTVGVASLIGGVAVDTLTIRDPSDMACAPEQKAVDTVSQDYVEAGGEVALLQEENAGKLWSVYSAMGGSKEQTAAVLGNLHYESGGLDPTATETIASEPFVMGPLKLDALAKDYNVRAIAPDYAARFPAIQRIGIGLAQWTNGRNSLLVNYAKDKGANWYDFDTQIGFMLAGDEPYRQEQLKDFLASTPGTIDAETERFMNSWIGLSSPNPSASARKEHAVSYLFTLERATADTAYAEGILSGLNVNRGEGNAAAGAFFHDDGCGSPLATHYAGDKAEDGTGEVPAGLALVPWTRETLPEGLRQFAVDPELAGLAWGSSSGWATGIYPGQCVALASSYFMQLYPDWNQGGRGTNRPTGNGKFTAGGWASHYGATVTSAPSTGAVFSNTTSSVYGHTGIVQHVFANGDILIAEQNIRGASGDANGQQYSWSWRVIKTDRYQQDKWTFFKPSDVEPQWQRPSA